MTNRPQPAGAFPGPGGPGNARGVGREPGPAVPRREQAREPAVPPGEQTRARYPDEEGFLKRDGARVFYEVYGTGEPAILLLPTWEIVHSRAWKAQIPYFARYSRVITFDRLGNGRSDRPEQVGAYDRRATADDARAVLEHAGVEQAVVVSRKVPAMLTSVLTSTGHTWREGLANMSACLAHGSAPWSAGDGAL